MTTRWVDRAIEAERLRQQRPPPLSVRTDIRLSHALHESVTEVAKEKGVTFSDYVRAVLSASVEDAR